MKESRDIRKEGRIGSGVISVIRVMNSVLMILIQKMRGEHLNGQNKGIATESLSTKRKSNGSVSGLGVILNLLGYITIICGISIGFI